MSIVRISFGFGSLDAAGVADMASEIVTKVGADPAIYPSPNPSLLDITTAVSALNSAIISSANKDRLELRKRDEKKAIVEDMLKLLGSYSVMVTAGDKIKLETGGWKVVERGPSVPVVPPSNLRGAYIQGQSGSMRLDWDRVKGATYLVQITDQNPAQPNTAWQYAGSTGKSKIVISEGLTPGTVYSFRIFAIKGETISGASSAISMMAV